MRRALFPFNPPAGVNMTATSPHVPALRLVKDAGDYLGPGTFGSYLSRVDSDWSTLAASIAAAPAGKIPGAVWTQFQGENGAWTQFRETYKGTIWPQDSADLDWWAARAKAWDGYLRNVPGASAGFPGPPAAGDTPPSTIGQLGAGASALGSKLLDAAPWIIGGIVVILLITRFGPEPRAAR
jgi:hypothetical protein